ncbi:UNVERIFIED_CONTAM: putative mitochondrial protein, partial [Sesamum calycinum]
MQRDAGLIMGRAKLRLRLCAVVRITSYTPAPTFFLSLAMASDLHRLGVSLSLTEEAEAGLVLPTGLWHSDPLNRGHFVGQMLARSPWAYDKQILVLAPVEASDDSALINLDLCEFHVHIHGLPLGKMTKEIATFIGNKLGKFKDVDLDGNGEVWGSSVRMRDALDITKPLTRALKVRTMLGDEHLISFSYEWLPNFCYFCGCLGHLGRQCDVYFESYFKNLRHNPPFRGWLQVIALMSSRHRNSGLASQCHPQPQPKLNSSRKRQLIDEEVDVVDLEIRGPRKGVGGSWTIRTLGRLIRGNNPSLVSLAETKCSVRRIELLKRQLDMNGIGIPAVGKSGGLARLVNLFGDLLEYMGNQTLVGGITCGLFCLGYMANLVVLGCVWVILNEILGNSEKRGGPPRLNWQMRNFRNALLECDLHDMGYIGDPFMWSNRQLAPHKQTCSDHKVLLIHLFDRQTLRSEGSRPWRFEAAWLQSEQCEKVVADSWAQNGGNVLSPGLSHHLELCQQNLKRWSSQVFKEEVAAQEETRWKQRSKELWLKEGDRNTSFFHRRASNRFHTNRIRTIQNAQEVWVDSEKGILECFVSHFQGVYASSRPSLDDIARGTECLCQAVDASIARDLMQPYTAEEVSRALFQMAPLKSPGPEGMNSTHLVLIPKCRLISDILLAFEINHFLNSISKRGPVSFSFMLGDKQFGSLVLETVLLQGDPLSPYLFLLCTKTFSSLLQVAEREGRLQGVSICRASPSISHLLFTDDTLIFCRASTKSTRAVLDVLEVYRWVSGQEINFSKSSVAFSRNMGEDVSSYVVKALTVRRENKMELYLGLPSKVSRSKKALLSTIRDRAFGYPVARNTEHDWVSAAPFVQPCHIGQAVVATLEIRVWHDPWLSRPRSFRPITPLPPDLASIRVSDLIDLVSKDWWVERVQQLFWPCDSTAILATPLNRVGETDLLVWHYSKDGSFSVRSAYHLALSLEDNPSSSSLAEGEVSWWRKVWQARVPNKVKVFVWRACVNALPTEMNLKKRIQNLQVVCPFCQAEFEDGLHTLFLLRWTPRGWVFSSVCVGQSDGSVIVKQWTGKVLLLCKSLPLQLNILIPSLVKLQPPQRLGP